MRNRPPGAGCFSVWIGGWILQLAPNLSLLSALGLYFIEVSGMYRTDPEAGNLHVLPSSSSEDSPGELGDCVR
jgi:hypothetical protein